MDIASKYLYHDVFCVCGHDKPEGVATASDSECQPECQWQLAAKKKLAECERTLRLLLVTTVTVLVTSAD